MSVLVNTEKAARAQTIVGFLTGTPAKTSEDQELAQRFASILTAEKVDPKSKEAVEFVYVKLGGLVRSEVEHKKMEEKKAAIKSKKSGRKDE